jgi:hypothetical protein
VREDGGRNAAAGRGKFARTPRAELESRREECGPLPQIDELREARRRLSPRARSYLRELAVRALVTEEALRMLASGELADVRFE